MVQEWGKTSAAEGGRWTTHLTIGDAASEGLDLRGQKQAKEMRTAFSFCFCDKGWSETFHKSLFSREKGRRRGFPGQECNL